MRSLGCLLLYLFSPLFFFIFLIRDAAKGQRCVRTVDSRQSTTNKRYQEFHFLAPNKTRAEAAIEDESKGKENKKETQRNAKTTTAITKRTHLAKIKKMPAN